MGMAILITSAVVSAWGYDYDYDYGGHSRRPGSVCCNIDRYRHCNHIEDYNFRDILQNYVFRDGLENHEDQQAIAVAPQSVGPNASIFVQAPESVLPDASLSN